MLQPYPLVEPSRTDRTCEVTIEWMMALLLGVRRIRGEINIAPGKPLKVILDAGSAQDRAYLEASRDFIQKVGRIESLEWLASGATAPESAIALVGDLKVLIPMSGLIDKDAELARLDKEIQRLIKEVPRLEGKLSDEGFLAKAPEAVVAKERARLDDLKNNLSELESQIQKIRAL
jgi:valyl-tRNA synthetase